MSLVNYSDSSTSEDSSDNEPDKLELSTAKKLKSKQEITKEFSLQLPNALTKLGKKEAQAFDEFAEYDNPLKHEGRTRSFKHERGNWATYVYIPVEPHLLDDILEFCQKEFSTLSDLHVCSNFHLSLSKTFILHYHLIESFMKSLAAEFVTCKRFTISLQKLKIYCNDEKTRTFIALEVDEIYYEKMSNLLHRVDKVMGDYKMPLFYKNPSFHISLLWCLGDKVPAFNKHLDKLKSIKANQEYEILHINIHEINCKSGNKQFKLQMV